MGINDDVRRQRAAAASAERLQQARSLAYDQRAARQDAERLAKQDPAITALAQNFIVWATESKIPPQPLRSQRVKKRFGRIETVPLPDSKFGWPLVTMGGGAHSCDTGRCGCVTDTTLYIFTNGYVGWSSPLLATGTRVTSEFVWNLIVAYLTTSKSTVPWPE